MSATSTDTPAGATPPVFTTHPTPTGSMIRAALLSEWTKLRSVRSTIWSLILTSAFTIGLGTLFCWAYVNRPPDERGGRGGLGSGLRFDPTDRALRGVFLAQLAIGVLGVLVMSSEYTTGSVRTSLAAVPNRRLLLLAKAIVLGAVSLVVSMISAFLAFFAGQAVLSSKNLGVSIGDAGVLRAVLGAGAYLMLIALFGLAIGTIVRRTPGAISALFGIVLIFPLLADALPDPWNVNVGKLLPMNAGQAMFSVRVDPDLLTPGKGLVIFLCWIAGTFAIATFLLSKRDV